MTKTNGEKRAVTSKYLVDVCNVATTIFPYTRALAKSPPSLTLGLVRQHALTKSVMEMTLWDFQACWRPCSSSTYTPGNHLAHSTCSLNGSSYSDNHDLASWKKQVVWSNKRQWERAPAGRKEALQWSQADSFASGTGYALPLAQWTRQHTGSPALHWAVHTRAQDIEHQSSGQINTN